MAIRTDGTGADLIIPRAFLPAEAAAALEDVLNRHLDEMDEALAPFGLQASYVGVPTWEHVFPTGPLPPAMEQSYQDAIALARIEQNEDNA